MWRFIHNCIAHPLLFFTFDAQWSVRLHDWSSLKMRGSYVKMSEKEAMKTRELLSNSLKAILLTRDYVGEESLPPVDGWEWFEAAKSISRAIPKDPWVKEFSKRVPFCPQCKSEIGVIEERSGSVYCEDCGWPDCDFAEG